MSLVSKDCLGGFCFAAYKGELNIQEILGDGNSCLESNLSEVRKAVPPQMFRP